MNNLDNKETVILNIIKEAYPELDASPGTPFYELAVRPLAYLWTRHEEGNEELTSDAYLSNYASMTSEALDRTLSNYFLTRKTGDYVYATIRMVFSELRDYYIQKGFVVLYGKYEYTTLTDTYISKLELSGDAINGYYVDVKIVSSGTSNVYNLTMNDALTTEDPLSSYIKKIYVTEDSTDGGIEETNTDFYNRASRSMALRNLTTYRGVKATLYDLFNVKEVLPVGLRDDEMRRDLVELDPIGQVHRGGMADIYVKAVPYVISAGCRTPLGFPYELNGVSITSDPDSLMATWNALSFPSIDVFTRGSMLESIQGLSAATNMKTLSSNIEPVHTYCYSTTHEAIHSDNLVKQMWPLVVRVHIKIPAAGTISYVNGVATDGTDQIAIAKTAIIEYIDSLSVNQAPKIANLVKAVIAAGIPSVTLPIDELKCYYVTENLTMQWFGANMERSTATSLLKPVETDSLKFVIDDDTQISNRNCMWYTNEDLITVEVV